MFANFWKSTKTETETLPVETLTDIVNDTKDIIDDIFQDETKTEYDDLNLSELC